MCLELIASFLGGGLLVEMATDRRRQRELVATVLALKNECHYNQQHRGNERNPFQFYWLEKAASNLDFYEQCESIANIALQTYELAKEANLGQLDRRRMVPSDVQIMMTQIIEAIEKTLPNLRHRTGLIGYCTWYLFGNLSFRKR